MKVTFVCMAIIILSGCFRANMKNDEQPIARVGNSFLYPSDIQGIFGHSLNSSDSVLIKRQYIDNWIKKQLLLQRAELNLNDQQKDVSKQIEDYRTSLLIFKYEQMLLQQELDTVISETEIVEYYENFSSNFILNKFIIKGLYIKVPISAPNTDRLKALYVSDKEDDIKQLESYCYQYAQKYDYFEDQWMSFDAIMSEIPVRINEPERHLRYNRTIEAEDARNLYLLRIKEHRPPGSIAPLDYVKNDIKAIILNKRKLRFIQELEENIFTNAAKYNKFEIY